MKKITLALIVCVLLFTVSCSKKEAEKKQITSKENVTKILPENTEFLFKLSSIANIYKGFDINENSVFGKALTPTEIEEMKTDLGFNILSTSFRSIPYSVFTTDKILSNSCF